MAPEYFGREYYCINHIGVKSISYIKLHNFYIQKKQLNRFSNPNHLDESVLKFMVCLRVFF